MPKKPKYNEVRCRACKEPIAVDATICPHCRTEFSADEVARRVKDQRTSVKIGCGCLLVPLAIFVLIGIFGDKGGSGAPASSSSDAAAVASDPAPGSASADVKAAGISFYKALFAGMKSCDVAGRNTAETAQRIQSGSSSIYDGYSAATAQVASCRESWSELDKIDVPDALTGEAEEAAEKAKETCSNAAIAKQMGGETMQEVFDGNMKPSKIQEMSEQARAAQAGVIACAAAAVVMAGKAGIDMKDIPKSD